MLEPETGEVVEEIFWSKPRVTLIPGRFDAKFGNLLWLGGVELKPGETTTIRPGVLKVASNLGIFYFYLRTPDGQEAARGDVPGQTKGRPAGGQIHTGDRSGQMVKQLTDEQRKMEIELTEGQEMELTIE